MAPVRRWTQLLGSVPVRDGVRPHPHGGHASSRSSCSSRSSTSPAPNLATAVVFMLLGSFSFVGIGMMAAILPLLYVERGAQMTFVLQSCLLLVSGRLLLASRSCRRWMQVLSHLSPGDVRPRRRAGRAASTGRR